MRYTRPLKKAIIDGSRALLFQSSPPSPKTQSTRLLHKNEYPFFFMHGFTGFPSFNVLSLNLFGYFNNVQTVLQQMGYTAYHPQVTAIESTRIRADMWARELKKALNQSGSKKVHIIAHGQGAIDARILACHQNSTCNTAQGEAFEGMGMNQHIASITSIAGPHLGTPILDHIETKSSLAIINDLLDYIAITNVCKPSKVRACMENLSRDYMINEFNPSMQIPNTIPCFTVSAHLPENQHNISLLGHTRNQLMDIAAYDGGGKNDGIVPLDSASFITNETLLAGTQQKQWQSLGEVYADHLGVIGISNTSNSPFDHLPLFIGLAQHVDFNYSHNMHMSLEPNGHWQRNNQVIPLPGTSGSANRKKAKVIA